MLKRSWLKRKTGLRKKGNNDVSKTKSLIQDQLRELAIARDNGCILNNLQGHDIPICGGYRNDGELILQYDHLNSRQQNVSYADIRLGVILCKGHHGWKHFTDNNKKLYDRIVRVIIGEERAKLWDKVENDRRNYPMSQWEWHKIWLGLNEELKKML